MKGQSANCSTGLPDNLPAYRCPLPFLCESRGTETRFINLIDREPGPGLWTARRRQDPSPVRHRPPLGGVRPLGHLRPGLPAGAGPAGSQARLGPAASTTQAPAVAPTAVPTQPDEGGTPGWFDSAARHHHRGSALGDSHSPHRQEQVEVKSRTWRIEVVLERGPAWGPRSFWGKQSSLMSGGRASESGSRSVPG